MHRRFWVTRLAASAALLFAAAARIAAAEGGDDSTDGPVVSVPRIPSRLAHAAATVDCTSAAATAAVKSCFTGLQELAGTAQLVAAYSHMASKCAPAVSGCASSVLGRAVDTENALTPADGGGDAEKKDRLVQVRRVGWGVGHAMFDLLVGLSENDAGVSSDAAFALFTTLGGVPCDFQETIAYCSAQQGLSDCDDYGRVAECYMGNTTRCAAADKFNLPFLGYFLYQVVAEHDSGKLCAHGRHKSVDALYEVVYGEPAPRIDDTGRIDGSAAPTPLRGAGGSALVLLCALWMVALAA